MLGETLERMLTRKLQQELGVEVVLSTYYMSLAEVNSKGPYTRVVFEVILREADDPINLTRAHSEYVWMGRDGLRSEKVSADSKKILEKYLGDGDVLKNDDINTTYTVYTDGGSRGNPGPSASAYVLYDQKNNVVETGGEYIGITTNNQAEYTAVLLALKAATRHADRGDSLHFYIDSLLVVNQLNGVYKIKNRELWPLNQEVRTLMTSFGSVHFTHIPREQNTAADTQVNQILDTHSAASQV